MFYRHTQFFQNETKIRLISPRPFLLLFVFLQAIAIKRANRRRGLRAAGRNGHEQRHAGNHHGAMAGKAEGVAGYVYARNVRHIARQTRKHAF